MSCTLHICCCRSHGKLHSAEDSAAKSNDKGRDGCCESEVQCSALNELCGYVRTCVSLFLNVNMSMWQSCLFTPTYIRACVLYSHHSLHIYAHMHLHTYLIHTQHVHTNMQTYIRAHIHPVLLYAFVAAVIGHASPKGRGSQLRLLVVILILGH